MIHQGSMQLKTSLSLSSCLQEKKHDTTFVFHWMYTVMFLKQEKKGGFNLPINELKLVQYFSV